jgi:Concanavalin A-like lectin/glucanases superfamily
MGDAPVSYFRLGEPTGTAAKNEVGGTGAQTVASGTYVASPSHPSGPIAHTSDRGVTFNGSTQYVSVPDGANVDLGDTFSLEMWVRRGTFGTAQTLMDKGLNAYRVAFNTDNTLKLVKDGVATSAVTTTSVMNTGWMHVVWTKSGATHHCYVNGVDRALTVTNQTMANNAVTLYLGARGGSSEFANASLDEVALYNYVLTQGQVISHYNAALTVAAWPDLVFEMALDSNPLDTTPVFRNYTEFVRSGSTNRGRSQELDRIEAGTASVTLKNLHSEWDPFNGSSPYNGTLLPSKPLKISFDWYGTRYPVYYGYVEGWPVNWDIGPYSDVKIEAADGLAMLTQMSYPAPPTPTLMGAWDQDISTFTDGAAFTAPNYAGTVWAQVTGDWWAESTDLRFRYTNQDGVGDVLDGVNRLLETNVSRGTLAATGTRLAVTLLDGDIGIRDVTAGGWISASPAPGKLAIFGQPESFPKVKSGTMINAILDAVGWPAGGTWRETDLGYSDILGFTPAEGDSPLAALQSTADAELGQFFMTKLGRTCFHDRHHRWVSPNAAIVAFFGDGTAASELPYIEIVPEFDRKRIKNDVSITAEGAPEASRFLDAASIAAYGPRGLALTLPIAVRREAGQMARQIRDWFSQPAPRFNQLTVGPTANAAKARATIATTLAREIGERVQVLRRPAGGTLVKKTCRIEGIAIAFAPKDLKVTFQLSPDVLEPAY